MTSLPAPATLETGDVNAVAAATTAAETAARKKLHALFNNISASVFELISDCTDYDTAIQVVMLLTLNQQVSFTIDTNL